MPVPGPAILILLSSRTVLIEELQKRDRQFIAISISGSVGRGEDCKVRVEKANILVSFTSGKVGNGGESSSSGGTALSALLFTG